MTIMKMSPPPPFPFFIESLVAEGSGAAEKSNFAIVTKFLLHLLPAAHSTKI